jgi:hypothetical protein
MTPVQELVEAVKVAYQHNPDLARLVGDDVVLALGLSHYERLALAGLLLELSYSKAMVRTQVRPTLFKAAVASLAERGLIELQDDGITFNGAATAMRMQTTAEAAAEEAARADAEDREPPVGRPKTGLVMRPIRERVIMDARAGKTAPQGLAKVYAQLYGPVPQFGWGVLGKLANLLGRDQGALFLLEHSYKPMRNPLRELLPQAVARSRGYRPDDAPEVAEQKRFEAAIANAARRKRGELV